VALVGKYNIASLVDKSYDAGAPLSGVIKKSEG
jgi:hypothetical protein